MSEWEMTTVGEVAEIFDGPHATPKKTEAGPWFLSISSLKQGQLDLRESAHLSIEDFKKWARRVTPREGDVLFSYETRLGEAALMPRGIQACLGRRMGLLRVKSGKADSRFLLYAYLGPEFQQVIRERSIHGATVDRIPLTDLPSWPIRIPSLPEQQAISGLLGALDDKIDANLASVRISNDLATTLFMKSFEDKDRVNIVRLGNLADVIDCLHSKKPEAVMDGRRYLVLADIREDSRIEPIPSFAIAEDDYLEWTRRLEAREGDCVITNVGRVGAVGQISRGVTAAIGRNMTGVRGRDDCPPAFLLEALRSSTVRREIEMKADQGTIMSALNVRTIPDLMIPAGTSQGRRAFQEKAGPLHRVQDQLLSENVQLARIRDTLLPKLMSGEIRVRNAEKVVEDVT